MKRVIQARSASLSLEHLITVAAPLTLCRDRALGLATYAFVHTVSNHSPESIKHADERHDIAP